MSDLINASVKTLNEMYKIDESKGDPAHAFAKEVVKKHPHLTTFKDPDNKGHHVIMHKDDEDGSAAGGFSVHHKDGKLHIHHEGTAMNDAPQKHSGSAEEMHKHADKIAKSIPKDLDEEQEMYNDAEQLDELSSYTKLGKLARKIIPGQGQKQAGERAKDQKYSAGLDRAALKYHPDDKKLATTMKSSEKAEKRYKRISRGEAPFKPSAND
jgi:hypothetical protein